MNIINIFFTILILVSCENDKDQKMTTNLVQSPLTADKDADEVAMPKIEVDQDFFDFVEMNQDESVSTEFQLKKCWGCTTFNSFSKRKLWVYSS